jgi:insulysin
MQKYPPALYVAGPLRLALDDFNVFPQLSDAPRSTFQSEAQLRLTRDEVGKYSNVLTVDNAMITVVSKSFSGKTDATEKWYGTEYRVRAVPRTTLDRWQNCEPARSLRIDFPSPNKFIPSEAGLQVKYPPNGSSARKKSFDELIVAPAPPRLVRGDDRWTVYFKEDRQFGKPKAYVVLQLQTKEPYASPKNAAMASLYELSVTDSLREYAYDGECRSPLLVCALNPSD